MRKFSLMTLLAAVVLLAGFVSCADDKIPGDEQSNNAVTADVQVRIAVDNGSQTKATRANDEIGDGNETGIADEYLVKNATLYFFKKADDTFVKSESFTGFVQDPTVTNNQVVWTSQNRKMEAGDYKVVVLVNGTAAAAPAVGSTIADFMKDVKTSADTWIASASSGLLMASRNPSADPVSSVSVSAANTPTNPAVVQAHVERTVAKVTLAGAADYLYNDPTKLPAGVSIKLTDYRMLNLRNEFFTFRHTAAAVTPVNPGVTVDNVTYGFGDLPNNTSYIMDPKTFMKNVSMPVVSGVDYRDWYAHTAFSTAIGNGTTETILGYSQENTMEKEAQKKGYGTAIVFKAQITGAGTVGAGENLYYDRKNKIFYNTYAALQAVFTTLHPTTPNYMELAAHDISAYKDGKTTYVYYIKHADNTTENNMGIMEYAMVRNNVYKINVTDITAPGRGLVPDPSDPTGSTPLDPANPTVPDGGDPTIDPAEDIETEVIDIALKVELTVKPWIIRNNNVVLK